MSKQPIVRYSGTFRFHDRPVLDRVLATARTQIDDGTDVAALDGGWLRGFTVRESTLTVNVAMPAFDEHRFAAAEVFAVLSRDALEGSVIATIDDVPVEYYSVTPWR